MSTSNSVCCVSLIYQAKYSNKTGKTDVDTDTELVWSQTPGADLCISCITHVCKTTKQDCVCITQGYPSTNASYSQCGLKRFWCILTSLRIMGFKVLSS